MYSLQADYIPASVNGNFHSTLAMWVGRACNVMNMLTTMLSLSKFLAYNLFESRSGILTTRSRHSISSKPVLQYKCTLSIDNVHLYCRTGFDDIECLDLVVNMPLLLSNKL